MKAGIFPEMKAAFLKFAVGVCLCLILTASVYSQSECYFDDSGEYLVLGNSRVEIRFSKTGGRVLDLKNKDTGYDFLRDDYNPSSYFIRYHNNPNKWNTSHWLCDTILAIGWDKALSDYRTVPAQDSITLEMDNAIPLGDGACTVTQRVTIFDGSAFTRWSITIGNQTETGKTVVSVTYPHLRGINVIGGDDYFITPQRRGERWEEFYFERVIPNGPTYHIRDAHYPSAPWQWIWYGNSRQGLYYAACDTQALPKSFRFGYDDREMSGQRYYDDEMALTHFPFLEPGGTWTSYEMEIGVMSGPGWYWGADRYREWMVETAGWKREYPIWAKEAHSLIQRWSVDDYSIYPDMFRYSWHPQGNYNLIDMGWYEDGNPEYYLPRSVLDDNKGGYNALVQGMEGCHAQGDRVLFFTSPYLADQDGVWISQHPEETIIDPNGNRIIVHFDYLPDKYFYGQCPWSRELRNTLIEDQRIFKNAGVDGTWLDCVLVSGLFREPFCYHEGHGHQSPADALGPGMIGLLRELNDEVWRREGEGTERVISIEGVNDFLIPYVDCWGMLYMGGYEGQAIGGGGERDYPEVARYLIPGVFHGLRKEKTPGVPDDTKPFPQASFTFGCKLGGPDGADRWKYYNAYDSAKDAFYHGIFKADLGLTKSRDDFKVFSFIGSAGRMVVVTLWNRGSSTQSIEIDLDLAAIGIEGSVSVAEDLMGRPLQWTGGSTFVSTVPIDQEDTASGTTAVKLTILPKENLGVLVNEGGKDLNIYFWNAPAVKDWTRWDALARNPTALARDFWQIPLGNEAVALASVDVNNDGRDELALLVREGADDLNIYFWNAPVAGDWTRWDALARNPSPVARDLWQMPLGNEAVGITSIDIDGDEKEELATLVREGAYDLNIYFWNAPVAGDWTRWDALARNPSALARDFWQIPLGNYAVGITSNNIDSAGRKELGLLVREGADDLNIYFWNAPVAGDWTRWDALARNPSAVAKDLWQIPVGNYAVGITSVDLNKDGKEELGIIVREYNEDLNIYFWNAPVAGDWTRWDALARNPSAVARDLWQIPVGNEVIGSTGIGME